MRLTYRGASSETTLNTKTLSNTTLNTTGSTRTRKTHGIEVAVGSGRCAEGGSEAPRGGEVVTHPPGTRLPGSRRGSTQRPLEGPQEVLKSTHTK
ncbi:hypothetical protein J4Q44_G00295160 [Coregonus suidteri]|uniref:Uncharacterized protein n=1 Tax=Coregonus suidteri TaxID=861788 RepID=A0AAN8KWM2_9TELE